MHDQLGPTRLPDLHENSDLMIYIRMSMETDPTEEAQVPLEFLLNSRGNSLQDDIAEEAQALLEFLLTSVSNPAEMVVSRIWHCMLQRRLTTDNQGICIC
jgi:hypothetical protein